MTELLRYKWTSFRPRLDEDGPFVTYAEHSAALRACEERVAHEERARIVDGIAQWCVDDPVISRADPDDVWDYAHGVRFTRLRIERGDFNEGVRQTMSEQ